MSSASAVLRSLRSSASGSRASALLKAPAASSLEKASVLGGRQQASLRDLREHAQLLDALQQAHRRLCNANLAALDDTILVEGDDLWQERKRAGRRTRA